MKSKNWRCPICDEYFNYDKAAKLQHAQEHLDYYKSALASDRCFLKDARELLKSLKK